MVGVGYHHPSVQWPNTPMDERQRGNLAAVACQGGLGLLGFRAPLSPTPWSFSPWLSRQRGTLCMTNSSSVALRAPPTLGASTLCLLTGEPGTAIVLPLPSAWTLRAPTLECSIVPSTQPTSLREHRW